MTTGIASLHGRTLVGQSGNSRTFGKAVSKRVSMVSEKSTQRKNPWLCMIIFLRG
jgi:hypothetical protein